MVVRSLSDIMETIDLLCSKGDLSGFIFIELNTSLVKMIECIKGIENLRKENFREIDLELPYKSPMKMEFVTAMKIQWS